MCKSSFKHFSQLCDQVSTQLSEPEVLALYYLLDNLRKSRFKQIKEVSIVKGDVFDTFFNKEETERQINDYSATSYVKADKVPFRLSSLLSRDNLLLTQHQKQCIDTRLLNYDKVHLDLDLHVHLGKEGDYLYLVFCECCASSLFRVLQALVSGLNLVSSDNDDQLTESSDEYIRHDFQAEFCIAAAFLQLFLYPSIPTTSVTLFGIFQSLPNLLLQQHLRVLGTLILNYPKEGLLWNLRYRLFVIYWSVAKVSSRRRSPGHLWHTHYNRYNDLTFKPSKNVFKACKLMQNELELSFIALQKNPTSNRVTRYWSNLYNYTRRFLNKHERYLTRKYLQRGRARGKLLKLGGAAVATSYKLQLLKTQTIANYYIDACLKLAQISGHPGMAQIIQMVLDDAKHPLDCEPLVIRVIRFCNANVERDRHNCWLENKTQILLWSINNLNRCNIPFKFKWILEEHLRTWQSFMDPVAIVRPRGNYKNVYELTDYEIGKSEAQKIHEYVESDNGDTSQVLRHSAEGFVNQELDRILNSFKHLLKIIHVWLSRALYLKSTHIVNSLIFKSLTGIVSVMLRGAPRKLKPIRCSRTVHRSYHILKSGIFLAYLGCSLHVAPMLVNIYKLMLQIKKTGAAPVPPITDVT